MSAPSPTVEGFRAAFRRPSFTFGEIAWRWSIGATAALMFTFYCVEYLDSLPVSNTDAILLASRQPTFVLQAVAHIVKGSLSRAVVAALIAALALSVLWIIAASFGRLATVSAVILYFRGRIQSVASERVIPDSPGDTSNTVREQNAGQPEAKNHPMRALIDLNFFRVAVALAMILALAGAAVLSSFVSTAANPRPDLAALIFLLIAAVIFVAAWFLNWWLSFAGIFAVRDGEDAFGALSAVNELLWQRPGAVLAVSTWTGIAHLTAFSSAASALGFSFALIQIAPARLVIAISAVVALLYFALADWLYVARLAGYICIAENPAALLTLNPPPLSATGGSATPFETSVDREEPILSDVPNLALET
jgi:hypothetical protein